MKFTKTDKKLAPLVLVLATFGLVLSCLVIFDVLDFADSLKRFEAITKWSLFALSIISIIFSI